LQCDSRLACSDKDILNCAEKEVDVVIYAKRPTSSRDRERCYCILRDLHNLVADWNNPPQRSTRLTPHSKSPTTSESQACTSNWDLSNAYYVAVTPALAFPRHVCAPIMCYIVYTIHSCNHWIPQPQTNNGPILRICDEAEKLRLGHPCPETQREHKVVNRSQGMCNGCLWTKVSK